MVKNYLPACRRLFQSLNLVMTNYGKQTDVIDNVNIV
jgi:hypothetical protein